jgi:5-aminopentanamidase
VTVVAACQLALAIGDLKGNAATVADAVAQAAADGADLIVLPELNDTGYVFSGEDEARSLATAASSPALLAWRALVATHGAVIAGGFCQLAGDGRLYNSAALVDASGTLAVYRKAQLWDAEKLIFTPGDEPPPVVELAFGRVALMICDDLEFPEWVRLAALAGADIIAAPVNWPTSPVPPCERPAEIIRAQASAAVNGCFIAVADRCQDERGVGWVGGTVIIGPDGYPLAGPIAADHGAVISAECDLARARDKAVSARNDLLADRRPALYGRVVSADPPAAYGARKGSRASSMPSGASSAT